MFSISLLVIIIASVFGEVIADTGNALSFDGSNWNGLYNTNIKSIGGNAKWTYPNTLLVAWDKEVQYNGTALSNVQFLNNSSISWTMDPKWGDGQIWFTNGDNRFYYWPNGALKEKGFTGWMQPVSTAKVDFRGEKDANYTVPAIPAPQPQTDSCGNCTGGKICSSGKCICPEGTSDCDGKCIAQVPCGGCDVGRVCVNGRCVCSEGTKLCNDMCIDNTECCGGCPPREVCSNGKCVCPKGVENCGDPMPL